jgi:hypothetical protein
MSCLERRFGDIINNIINENTNENEIIEMFALHDNFGKKQPEFNIINYNNIYKVMKHIRDCYPDMISWLSGKSTDILQEKITKKWNELCMDWEITLNK